MTNATIWQPLGAVAPGDLVESRIQAHWAAQLLAGAADSFAQHADDDSHSNLGWVDPLRALVGRPLGRKNSVHLGLRIEDLTILLMDESLEVLAELALADRELEWARSELSRSVSARVGAAGTEIVFRDYDMPAHPVAEGGRFDANPAHLVELRSWYANAALELGSLADSTQGAAEVRCWPHHFDLGTLVTLEGKAADGNPKTIGVGMTPGDDYYPEPYWYVTPYPYPEDPTLEPLGGGGQWHRDGWLGAVLVGEAALDGATAPVEQRDRLRAFLEKAIDTCRQMIAA